jgi:hypothetical protein
MPGFWHHMEYIEGGVAISLRALQSGIGGKITGFCKLFGMRNIDTLMKTTVPKWWHNQKRRQLYHLANRKLKAARKN